MLSSIVLAAGLSSRFGSPKSLASINGKTALAAVQHTLIASVVDEIIVVLGAQVEEVKSHLLKHKKIRFVHNKDYKLGQTSSFQCGLKAMDRSSLGAFLFPVDCPFVKPATVDFLADCFEKGGPQIVIPVYQGRKGHPPVFPQSLQQKILALPPSCGLNTFIHENIPSPRFVEVRDAGVIQTFNTPEELEQIQREHDLSGEI